MNIFKLVIIFIFITSFAMSQSVPSGAQLKNQKIKGSLPTGWTSVLGWMHAATIEKEQDGKTALITIDYFKFYEYDLKTKTTKVIYEENYDEKNQRNLDENEGRLFPREPKWYNDNAEEGDNTIYNSKIKNGYLIIDVSKTPKNIVHWWMPQQEAKPNCEYYMEVSAKIEGFVGLQIGSDWWEYVGSPWCGDEKCNKLAWISDWYGDTNGQFIIITAPVR